MSKEYWKKKKKEKKKETRKVCQKCYELFHETEVYLIFKDSKIPHWYLACNKCKLSLPEGTISKPYSKRKKKKEIDTKGWIEGEPTKKGNKRYIFITEDDKEVILLAETGVKKGLEPKKK